MSSTANATSSSIQFKVTVRDSRGNPVTKEDKLEFSELRDFLQKVYVSRQTLAETAS